jgi:hypothetical protein
LVRVWDWGFCFSFSSFDPVLFYSKSNHSLLDLAIGTLDLNQNESA